MSGERALLYLIAGVFGVASVVILSTAALCLFNANALVEGRWKCDSDNRIFDLLNTLISSALALYAGRKSS